MSVTWNTKWGLRRVRVELPTIEEALDAAAGLTSDPATQIQMVADLMERPLNEIKGQAEQAIRRRANRLETLQPRMGRRTVVVERKPARRALRVH